MPSQALRREQTRILFYCSAGGAVVQGLARMIEAQIPHSRVDLIDDPLQETERQDVGLLLLYGLNRHNGTDTIVMCQKAYPQAALGLVVESIGEEITLYGTLFDNRVVQGVLPLNFELDVWLAAVAVLLSGGEFYPFARRRQSIQAQQDRMPAPVIAKPSEAFAKPVNGVSTLTPRERDILRLISQGCQNKVIADRVGLSEHTVKVHVHNLIAKLHVTNRTQAAITFLASAGQEDAQRHDDKRLP